MVGAISNNIAAAEVEHREASVITFMATASGMSLFGLGSAFRGVVIGCGAYAILSHDSRRASLVENQAAGRSYPSVISISRLPQHGGPVAEECGDTYWVIAEFPC